MDKAPSVFKDLISGMRSLVAERLVSPLLPAFITSWLIVNYRVVITIISDEALYMKFSIIDDVLFPSSFCVLTKGFLIPLGVAFFYIFLYPYPAKWVYGYALNSQRELREKRQEIEKARVLTVEESQELMTYFYDREAQLNEQLTHRMRDIEQLRAKISELENEKSKTTATDLNSIAPQDEPSLNSTLSMPQFRILKAMSMGENNGLTYMDEEEIRRWLGNYGNDVTGLRIDLEDLLLKNLINRTSGKKYFFEHKGRIALKEFEAKHKEENQDKQ